MSPQTGLTTLVPAVGVHGNGGQSTFTATDPRQGVQSTKVQVHNATTCDLSIQIGADQWSVAAAQATTLPLVPNSGIIIVATNNAVLDTPNGTVITLIWMLDSQEPPEPDGPLTSAVATGSGTPTVVTTKEAPQFEAYRASGTGPILLNLYTITGSFIPSVTYPAGFGPADYKTAIVEVDWTPAGGGPFLCTAFVQDGEGNAEFFYTQFKCSDNGTLTLAIPLPYAPTGGFPDLEFALGLPGGRAWNISIVFMPQQTEPYNNAYQDGVTSFPPVLLPPYSSTLNPYGIVQQTNSAMPPYLAAIGAEYPTTGTIQPLQVTNSGLLRAVLDSVTAAPGSPTPADAVLVGGTDGTDLRAILTDSSGRLVLAPGSVASNVTIVGPLNGAGQVETSDAADGTIGSPAPGVVMMMGIRNASANAAIVTQDTPGVAPSAGRVAVASSWDGTNTRLLLTDTTGQLKVLVQGTVPVSIAAVVSTTDAADGTPGSAVPTKAIQVGGSDGTDLRTLATDTTGQLKVLVENTPAVTISGTPTVNLGQVVAAPGSPIPTDGVLVGGSDGTDLRAISTDTSGRVNVTVQLAQAATGAAVPADAVMVGGTDGTDLRALSVDSTGKLQVTITGQPVEVKGGSVTSVSVYPVGGTSQAVVTCTATTLTAFLAAPSAGTAYRIISITAIATGGASSTAFWAVGNSALTATIAAGNVGQTVLLNGQLWIPAYGSIDAKISASTPNVLFTMYYDVVSTVTIT